MRASRGNLLILKRYSRSPAPIINIKFLADLKQFSSQMQNANRGIEKVGKKMQKIGAGLTVGLTAPLLALGAASINAFDKQAKAIAQVEAGLKTTQGQVGLTSNELQKMASDLQNNSLFGDEEILQGVTAQLLTFTNVAGEQFARTQQAALDLSTRLDGDLKSSAIQLGKALNDPVANLSALSRSGIQFSEDQKKTINALVSTNKLADAQTIILDELEKQYGGSAAAAAAAGKGPLTQLGNILGDITEDFGKVILEGIQPFVGYLKNLAVRFQNLSPTTKKWIVILGGVAAAIGPLLALAGTILPLIGTGFTLLLGPIGLVVAGLVAAAVAMGSFGESSSAAIVSIEKERKELFILESKIKDVNTTNEDRIKLIDTLKAKYPSLLSDIRSESIGNLELSQRLALVNSELVNKIILQKQDDKIQNAITDTAKSKLTILEREDAIREQMFKVAEKENLVLKDGLSLREQARDLIKQVTSRRSLNGVLIDPVARLSQQVTQLDKANLGYNAALTQQNALTQAKIDLMDRLGIKQKEFNDLKDDELETPKPTVLDDPNRVKIKALSGLSAGLTPLENSPLTDVVAKLPGEITIIDEALLAFQNKLLEFQIASSVILQSVSENFASGFADIVAGIAQGTVGFGAVGGLLLATLGDLATQIGKAAIKIGLTMKAVKLSFSNPATAIAAGLGLVIVGSLLKGLASNFGGGSQDAGAFANGGIVGGSSFYGDKLLARVNSGELILNTDQQKALYGLMQSSDHETTTTTRQIIDGDKLILVTERAQRRKDRRG